MARFATSTVLVAAGSSAARTQIEAVLERRTEIRLVSVALDDGLLGHAQREQPSLIVLAGVADEPGFRELCTEMGRLPVTADIPLLLVAGPEHHRLASDGPFAEVVYEPLVHDDLLNKVRRFVPLRQRRHPRFPINLRFAFEARGERGQAFSRVLSCGGAFLKTDRALDVGESLSLRFRLPGASAATYCSGIVRSSLQWFEDPTVTPGFGLEFRDLSLPDREQLQHFVDSLGRHEVRR